MEEKIIYLFAQYNYGSYHHLILYEAIRCFVVKLRNIDFIYNIQRLALRKFSRVWDLCITSSTCKEELNVVLL